MSMCRWCNQGHKYCQCENSLERDRLVRKDGTSYQRLRPIKTKLANFSPKTLDEIRRVKNET